MKIETEEIERLLLQQQIKVIIAVLELSTRLMAAGKEINDLVQQLREVLGNLMDDTAKDQIKQWAISGYWSNHPIHRNSKVHD